MLVSKKSEMGYRKFGLYVGVQVKIYCNKYLRNEYNHDDILHFNASVLGYER